MTLAMTKEERESFLAGVHIGIISLEQDGAEPLAVPIWYRYEPGGEVRIVTGRESRKGKLLEAKRRFTLCVQTEAPPYKYVSVSGPVVAIEQCDVERDLRPLAHRYLGVEVGDRYVAESSREVPSTSIVVVRMKPKRWLSVDYAKKYGTL